MFFEESIESLTCRCDVKIITSKFVQKIVLSPFEMSFKSESAVGICICNK